MTRYRIPVAIAGAAGAALLAAACSSAPSGTNGGGNSPAAAVPVNTQASGKVKPGGSVTTYVGQQIFGFDSAGAGVPQYGAQGAAAEALYDMLFYVDPKTNKVMPELGKSMTPVAGSNCKTWDMTLKSGITFTDGTPLNAAAVVYNYRRLLDPKTDAGGLVPPIQGDTFTAKSAQTLQIGLTAPDCQFDVLVANNYTFIGSPTAMKKWGANYFAHPVGAGPFMLASWQRSAGMATMVANPHYWQPGQPYLDKLTIIYASNPTTAMDAMLSGQAQLMPPVGGDPSQYDQAVSHGLGTWEQLLNGGTSLQFNFRRAPFNHQCAREAVAYGLNPAGIVAATDKSKYLTGVAATVFEPGSQFYDPNVKFPSYDPGKAAQLAQQCAKQGAPLTFTFTANAGADNGLGQYVQSALNAIPGFKVTLKVLSIVQATTQVAENHDFDLVPYPGSMFFGDPVPPLNDWLHSNGELNITGYASPAMDAALAAGDTTLSATARKSAYEKVQRLWTTDLPFLLYGKAYYFFMFDKKLTGINPVNPGNELLLFNKVGYVS